MPRESRYALRLPQELYELVKSEAAKAGRSMNEHIVFILTDYYKVEGGLADLEKRIIWLEANIRIRSNTSDNVRLDVTTTESDAPPSP